MLALTLPYPPSVNAYWRHVVVKGAARVLISKEGRVYREAVIAAVRKQFRGPALAGRLAVDVLLYPPDKRRRDVDNASKALLDSLAHAGVYADDSQIDELWIERREQKAGGYVVVRISPVVQPVPERIGGVA